MAGGFLAMMISAILWAVITVTSNYQIGYMAVGVGLLVGFSVRFFGAGIDKIFGYSGAAFALLGCIFGNLFSQIGFTGQQNGMGFLDVLALLSPQMILDILIESFNPMDILFYGIAIYEGYKFSFRQVTPGLLEQLKDPQFEPFPPKYKLRKPLAVVSFLGIIVFYFIIRQSAYGNKTFYYESGEKMSEGKIEKALKQGYWVAWHENGAIYSTGYYIDDAPDSIWQWFNEYGKVIKTGKYRNGLEHGPWINYYDNGTVADSGTYYEGRITGLFIVRHPNGKLYQKGYYNRNAQDSLWEVYYENGQLNTMGNFEDGSLTGIWKSFYETGKPSEVARHTPYKSAVVISAWDPKGKQVVTDGFGTYSMYSATGKVIQTGKIENGKRAGVWKTYYDDDKIQEAGHYENDMYFIDSFWDYEGKQIIQNGTGTYTTYHPDSKTNFQTGEISNGLKTGVWKLYYGSGKISQEITYKNGKLNGLQKSFSEDGNILDEGNLIDDLQEGEWIWYNGDGSLSSKVNFKKGKKDGKQVLHNSIGKIVKEEYYDNGILVREIKK